MEHVRRAEAALIIVRQRVSTPPLLPERTGRDVHRQRVLLSEVHAHASNAEDDATGDRYTPCGALSRASASLQHNIGDYTLLPVNTLALSSTQVCVPDDDRLCAGFVNLPPLQPCARTMQHTQ